MKLSGNMIVFWAGVIILLIWLFLKDIGVINTPLILQILPYLTVFVVLLALAREFGRYTHKIDRATRDIREIRLDVKEMRTDMSHMDKRVAVLEV